MDQHTTTVLCILDGFGASDSSRYNAINDANTPNWDDLIANYPHSLLQTSGSSVGLPEGQMGNSEVGHMNIGSGRIVMQELPRIDAAINDGSLHQHPDILSLITTLKEKGKSCHLLGMISPGGVHSHQSHVIGLAHIIASNGIQVHIHAFTDGRDVAPGTALHYMQELQEAIESGGQADRIHIRTVSGRYYAMDRDNRFERVCLAYDAITTANSPRFENVQAAIQTSFDQDITDEFMLPAVIGDYEGAEDGDALIMANFRSDRVRQILAALVIPTFDGFKRSKQIHWSDAIGMVDYGSELSDVMHTLFPSESLPNVLGEYIANQGLKQLRISETEKYAHVTFFFNGGREEAFDGEDRILIPSPAVATYDLQPEMSAKELTDKLVEAIESKKYDVIIVNYPNTDMVGHTGIHEAAVKAVEAVDQSLGSIKQAIDNINGLLLVTADHGNAELMYNEQTQKPHTSHTTNPVPFVMYGRSVGKENTLKSGRLCDIAPTLLASKGIEIPKEMTGESLL